MFQVYNTNTLLAAENRYNTGYYNGVYDNYNNPWGYKSGYNNPASYNPDLYNTGYNNPAYYNANRLYNRRSYPGSYEGSPKGPNNSGYNSGYYNNTAYPYGNYPLVYEWICQNPYHCYRVYKIDNPYNHADNERYYNSGYYDYNNTRAYRSSDAAGISKDQ